MDVGDDDVRRHPGFVITWNTRVRWTDVDEGLFRWGGSGSRPDIVSMTTWGWTRKTITGAIVGWGRIVLVVECVVVPRTPVQVHRVEMDGGHGFV